MTAFAGLAAYFILTNSDPISWPFIAVPALMSAHFFIFALRIYFKVKSLKNDLGEVISEKRTAEYYQINEAASVIQTKVEDK